MTIDIGTLAAVYLCFAAKHFLADYPLQSRWMVQGKAAARGWLRPLAAHAGVHAAGTLLIALIFRPHLWWLAPIDFGIHLAVDRLKAVATRGWTPAEPRFWWAFGADQSAHQLTHFVFVLLLLTA